MTLKHSVRIQVSKNYKNKKEYYTDRLALYSLARDTLALLLAPAGKGSVTLNIKWTCDMVVEVEATNPSKMYVDTSTEWQTQKGGMFTLQYAYNGISAPTTNILWYAITDLNYRQAILSKCPSKQHPYWGSQVSWYSLEDTGTLATGLAHHHGVFTHLISRFASHIQHSGRGVNTRPPLLGTVLQMERPFHSCCSKRVNFSPRHSYNCSSSIFHGCCCKCTVVFLVNIGSV